MSATSALPKQIRALLVARAVNQLGGFSLAFLTVLLTRSFGASLTAAGIVSAAFGLATIPSRLAGGRLADRWGRRRTIVAGLVGCAVAQLGLATAPGLVAATVCAVLLGLAFELFEPPSQAAIADAVPPAGRASAFELFATALAAGSLAAGLIADVVGRWSLRWLFVVDAGTGLVCAVIVWLALAPDHLRSTDQQSEPELAAAADNLLPDQPCESGLAATAASSLPPAQSPAPGLAATAARSLLPDQPSAPGLAVTVPPARSFAPGLVATAADSVPPARLLAPDLAATAAGSAPPGQSPAPGLAATAADSVPVPVVAAAEGVLPADQPSAIAALPVAPPSISPWRDRALLLVTAAGTVFALVSMLMLTGLPLSLAALGLNPAAAGLIMAASTATLVLARPVLRRRRLAGLPHAATFVLGYVLMAAGFGGYALAHTLPTLLVPTALYSLGNVLVMGRSFALVSELAPAEASARYLAIYGSSWGVATLLAPLVVTWLIGVSGPALLWGASAVVCAGMAVGQPWVVRRVRGAVRDLGVIHSTKAVAERYDAVSI
ncbi:MFS family permease [Catenulispora sp. GAS73]|uniref:MFS transporter n=1 Tax=Catenulispora sp. GAS73 TaxID=3156269 RepID=UPI003512BCE0